MQRQRLSAFLWVRKPVQNYLYLSGCPGQAGKLQGMVLVRAAAGGAGNWWCWVSFPQAIELCGHGAGHLVYIRVLVQSETYSTST